MPEKPKQSELNDKASRQIDAVMRAVASLNDGYIDDAFRALESVFTFRFYPEIPLILREQLDPAIVHVFDKMDDPKYKPVFIERLTQIGLPVVANGISDRELLRILAITNPSYEWQWHSGTSPQGLVSALTQEHLDELQRKVRMIPFWEMRASTNVLTWSPAGSRESKIDTGGVRIELNRESRITGEPKRSLHLHKVNLFPYATGCMVLQSRRPGFSNRREVTINMYDKISHGLR